MEKTKGKAVSIKVKKRKKERKMIKILNDMGEALAYCFEDREDKTFSIVLHTLKEGEVVKPHYHKVANEFIIMEPGYFKITVDSETKVVSVYTGCVCVIFLPKKKVHSIEAVTPLSYYVIRDKKDRSIHKRN